MAQLDEDDILHPEETIRRLELGIDTSYLVVHFGKGSVHSSAVSRENRTSSDLSYSCRLTENEYIKDSTWVDYAGANSTQKKSQLAVQNQSGKETSFHQTFHEV